MLKIKLSIFQIFIALLFILVITVIIANKNSKTFSEGYTSSSTLPAVLQSIIVNQYSPTKIIIPLNDDSFFDESNGNIIITDAVNYDNSTIKNMVVIDRTGRYTNYSVENTISAPNMIPITTVMTEQYTSWMFPSEANMKIGKSKMDYQIEIGRAHV